MGWSSLAQAQGALPFAPPPAASWTPEAGSYEEVLPDEPVLIETYVAGRQSAVYGDPMWEPIVLPDGLIYRAYLANLKQSRLAGSVMYAENDSTLWDGVLGGQVSLLRYGTRNPVVPEGFEIVAEGSAQVRLDVPEDVDVRAVDFRAGIFGAYGDRWLQTKFGYYHLSSHLGDEFLIKNEDYDRLNYARDVLVLGQSLYVTDDFRIYAEVGYAFYAKEAKPWEFQTGIDWAPRLPTGIGGAPFLALNGHFREDVNFGGNFTAQTGWAWRGDSGHLLRLVVTYVNGNSTQYSFFQDSEQLIGGGVFYDF